MIRGDALPHVRFDLPSATRALSLLAVVLLALTGFLPRMPVTGGTLALGDSITYGTPDPASGWVATLEGSDTGFASIVNAGVSGDRTDQMLARLERSLLAGRPTRILVLGGTNDIAQGVPVATIAANLERIVERGSAAGAQMVLLTIPPRAEREYLAATVALDAAIDEIGGQRGVQVIDINGALAASDGTFRTDLTDDGIHPNAAGYRLMAMTIAAALRAAGR